LSWQAALPPSSGAGPPYHNKNLRLQQKQKRENTAFALPQVMARRLTGSRHAPKAAMDSTPKL
jgi:hypothetical protein